MKFCTGTFLPVMLGCCGVLAAATTPARDAVSSAELGERTWSHVRILAADDMEGRRAGGAGYARAAQYVTEQFRKARLAPGAANGFLDRVDLIERQIDETHSSLALVERGRALPLNLGEDGIFNLRSKPAARIEAPLVFAGYGLRIPVLGIDDLRGLDVRGKVVVAFLAAPTGIPGAVQAHFGSPAERWKVYRAAGAVGVAYIPNPFSMDLPWNRVARTRLEPFMSLADGSFDEFGGQEVWITLNPARIEKLFEGAPSVHTELLALLKAGQPLPRFDLPRSLRVEVTVTSEPKRSDNVVGILRGADKQLRNECVVVSAHLDHLGIATTPGKDRIFNGAMDNAAGVAVLIEVARQLRTASRRPRRSIMFLAATAEEMGHLGSRAYARRATTSELRAVANVNSDMFLPLFPLKQLIVFGLDESDLGDDVRAVAAPLNIEVQADPEPLRNRFIRSDQYSFVRLGIPAVALKTGFTIGSPEQTIERQWFAERYHAPADDLVQPVDLTAAGRYVELMTNLLIRVANREDPPAWNANSFFATLAARKSPVHE
jgi:Peptidase family M28